VYIGKEEREGGSFFAHLILSVFLLIFCAFSTCLSFYVIFPETIHIHIYLYTCAKLRCGGVLEAVRVSRAGYPNRLSHAAFLARYKLIKPSVKGSDTLFILLHFILYYSFVSSRRVLTTSCVPKMMQIIILIWYQFTPSSQVALLH
jgi:hypothetical protein